MLKENDIEQMGQKLVVEYDIIFKLKGGRMKCKHKYKIVEYCENCGDVIEVRFLEGVEE